MTVSTNVPKSVRPRHKPTATDASDRRFDIINEALSKLYLARAMADIICFEKEMPDSLDDQTVTTLKFSLWQCVGEIETLLDCSETKS